MLFLGHIAASLLLADATDSDRVTVVAGAMLPDVTDKTGAWILHKQPSRWLAHGLPFFTLVALLTRADPDARRSRGFILGYAGHLLCDLWAGDKVPWFAPFEKQRQPKRNRSLLYHFVYLIPEFVGAAIIWRLVGKPADEA
jgi:membrane-bound metal-dependent hydrolase YbcI (DUF457 family)